MLNAVVTFELVGGPHDGTQFPCKASTKAWHINAPAEPNIESCDYSLAFIQDDLWIFTFNHN